MKPVARIFESGDRARDAAHKLEAAGYETDKIFVMAPAAAPAAAAPAEGEAPPPAPAAKPVSMSAEELVEKVSPAGELEITRAILLSKALASGKSVVVVGAYYGYVGKANAIMDDCGAESVKTLETAKPDNPSPFSDLIGMPCLENRLSFFSGDNPLKDSNWTAFPVNLSSNPAPFSSKLGMKTLSSSAAPFSSMIGMKPLSKEKPWRTSFGFKLLTNQQD
jgi:hypothetical protein